MKQTHQTLLSWLPMKSAYYTGFYFTLTVGAAIACSSPGTEPGVIDANGDGVADHISGRPIDTDGDGLVDSIDTNGDNISDGKLVDTDGDGIFDAVDVDGDGTPDGAGGGPTASGGADGGGNAPASGGAPLGNSGGGPASGGAPVSTGNCVFTISGVPAEQMPTVGVVEFSVTGLPGALTEGKIEFGLTTEYGLEAPIDVAAPMYKTLLLGMKKQREYNYRVVVTSGTTTCTSDNQTIMSGTLRNGVNELTSKMVTGTVGQGFFIAAAKSTALIFDQDGDVVWGYAFQAGGIGATAGIFAAKMTFDGKYMLARDLGQFNAGNQGRFFRVAMDGSGLTDFDVQGGDHHDFTVMPGKFAYIAKGAANEYDKIYTANDDGSDSKPLIDIQTLLQAYPPAAGGAGTGEKSHVNVIHYWSDRKIFTLSDRESDMIGVVSETGEVVQGIGKQATASFPTVLAEGAGTTWRVQHGHDLYAPDKLLVFSNGPFSVGPSPGAVSRILHYTLSGNQATLDWEYAGAGNSATQGDVQMLPNGNVMVTASVAGTTHVINAQQQLQASYGNGNQGFGYMMFRESLYGAPPDGR